MGEASFESLPQALRSLAEVRDVRRNGVLFRRGDRAGALFCVVSGEVRLLRYTAEGAEVVQLRARPGDFFAEAALSGDHYHCHAVCSKTGQVAVFDVEKLRSCMLREPSLAMLWIQVLSRHLRAARTRIERLGLKGARRRVLHWLTTEIGDSGSTRISQPLKAWASELGLAHETLYRALADLQADGIIRRCGRSIELLERRREP